MKLFQNLYESIKTNRAQKAFCISERFYSYQELLDKIEQIRNSLRNTVIESEKIIGLIANNDLETYAAILALWFEGKAYIPLNPDTPKSRNQNIINQVGLSTIIDSSQTQLFTDYQVIRSSCLPNIVADHELISISDTELAYLFFTSGTTGVPKGVSITRSNLSAFIDAIEAMNLNIDSNDRCLQMFDLTFDLSVFSFLYPLLKGACIYTIPKEVPKYLYVYKLMDEQGLTFALMVPSLINSLRLYFDEICCPHLKYSLFCGEALHSDLVEGWSRCVPMAKIINVYGPTEHTIFCTSYYLTRNQINKTYNGILSLGKALGDTEIIVVDECNNELPKGKKGELCLSGKQQSPGYWENQSKNDESFIHMNLNGVNTRFYKTGDLCYIDSDNDIFFIGRKDAQVKVQGYRIELTEIEFYAHQFLKTIKTVALALYNQNGNTEIALAIESPPFDTAELSKYLKKQLPSYMLPTRLRFVKELPHTDNGKINKNALSEKFSLQ